MPFHLLVPEPGTTPGPGHRAGNHSRGRRAAPAGCSWALPEMALSLPGVRGADRPAGRPAPQGRAGSCWAAGSPVGPGRATRLRVGPCTPQPPPEPPVLCPRLPVHTSCCSSIILARAKPSPSLPKAWWRYCLLQEVSPRCHPLAPSLTLPLLWFLSPQNAAGKEHCILLALCPWVMSYVTLEEP